MQFPQTDASQKARFLIGQIYFKQARWKQAHDVLIPILESQFLSERLDETTRMVLSSLLKLHRYRESFELIDRLLEEAFLSENLKYSLYKLRLKLLKRFESPRKTIANLIYLSDLELNGSRAKELKDEASQIVRKETDLEFLFQLARKEDLGFFLAEVYFRIGELYMANRDLELAKTNFERVFNYGPFPELSKQTTSLLKQIESLHIVKPFVLGAVLPLSGKNASVSKKFLRGLQLGLGIFGSEPSPIRLAVVNSGNTPGSAKYAFEQLIAEDHAIAIIGSLLSRNALAIAQQAQSLNVPNINISQKR